MLECPRLANATALAAVYQPWSIALITPVLLVLHRALLLQPPPNASESPSPRWVSGPERRGHRAVITVSASVGVAVFPQAGRALDDLMHAATSGHGDVTARSATRTVTEQGSTAEACGS